ncbi:MAG: hypothetical protein JSS43_25865 [Proteobacteria bacterium]|nr:hypothetical protein [Pseudomonadota bacterium]
MPEIAFLDRLHAAGLDSFPEKDRAALEQTVQSMDAAAARIRLDFAFADEPSNVFRLAPAARGTGQQT